MEMPQISKPSAVKTEAGYSSQMRISGVLPDPDRAASLTNSQSLKLPEQQTSENRVPTINPTKKRLRQHVSSLLPQLLVIIYPWVCGEYDA